MCGKIGRKEKSDKNAGEKNVKERGWVGMVLGKLSRKNKIIIFLLKHKQSDIRTVE